MRPPFGFIAQSVEQGTENPCVAGSIPAGATIYYVKSVAALVAQLDRVFGYEPKGQGFESLRAHHYYREMAQLGRALGLGPRGCRFKSCFPDHLKNNPYNIRVLFCKKNKLGLLFIIITYIIIS